MQAKEMGGLDGKVTVGTAVVEGSTQELCIVS